MIKALNIDQDHTLWYYCNFLPKNGCHEKLTNVHRRLVGNCGFIYGNGSGIEGNCSELEGDCTGIHGNCTGLVGNFDKCGITDEERKIGIDINLLISK